MTIWLHLDFHQATKPKGIHPAKFSFLVLPSCSQVKKEVKFPTAKLTSNYSFTNHWITSRTSTDPPWAPCGTSMGPLSFRLTPSFPGSWRPLSALCGWSQVPPPRSSPKNLFLPFPARSTDQLLLSVKIKSMDPCHFFQFSSFFPLTTLSFLLRSNSSWD